MCPVSRETMKKSRHEFPQEIDLDETSHQIFCSRVTGTARHTVPMSWMEQLENFESATDVREHLLQRFWGSERCLPDRVSVVGASHLGINIIDALEESKIFVQGVFDDDPKKQDVRVRGLPIRPVQDLVEVDRNLPIVLATHCVLGLQKQLKRLGFHHIWPFPFLSILDSKKFPPHPFYDRMIEDLFGNRVRLRELAMILGDEKSRRVLDAVIGFRLTLNAEFLEDVIDPDAYLSAEIFRFYTDEVLIDGGAFDGDTIRTFMAKTSGKFKRIVAFEPSRQPFEILRKNFEDDVRIHPLQVCLFDRETMLLFDDSGQRDSAITESNGGECRALRIDDLPEAGEITFIKLNVEGAEYNALLGAAQTIRKRAPKLAIAAYHQPEDLWVLPQLIKGFYPGYELYLRQHNGGIIETVLYAKVRDTKRGMV